MSNELNDWLMDSTDNTAVIRALEQRVEELEKGIMKQHEENARLRDTIAYARTRFEAYDIVDIRLMDDALGRE